MMQLRIMPLPRYLQLHPEAKVTVEDLETIKGYLPPWSSPIPAVSADNLGGSGGKCSSLARRNTVC